MQVYQIKIDFNITEQIKRYVYVCLIETEKECYLVDSGVSGSETIIEKFVALKGHRISDIKGIFLTHAHPDHIGTAHYFQEKYGTTIYASEGEKSWIEDIDIQFAERPIPNFYNLVGKSASIDVIVKDGDVITLGGGVILKVISTPGHSVDEVSYLVGNNAFIGDAIPVKGDIPIYVNRKETIKSLNVLSNLCGIERFYPAWDRAYSFEMLKEKIENAFEIDRMIEDSITKADKTKNLSELIEFVCEDLKMPMLNLNLLFEKTILSYFDS